MSPFLYLNTIPNHTSIEMKMNMKATLAAFVTFLGLH